MYWRQADDCLIAPYGWDAWWVDQCEPDNGDLLDLRRQSNFSIGRGIDYFNTYSLMHSTGLYSNWRNDVPGKTGVLPYPPGLCRSAAEFITLWSSDISCTWRALQEPGASGN